MELRHLRFFVAVAEEGSFTVAAGRRLHTAQPSLSRQIRDLETEVGTTLLTRSTRGVSLTAAGRVFLEHARLALAQVEAAGEGARRAAQIGPAKLALGFLSGLELEWLPAAMHVLRDELPRIEVAITSQYSPSLADALAARRIDAAFMRPESDRPELVYRLLRTETLVAVMASDHRLAAAPTVDPRELAREVFIGMSDTAPTVRRVIAGYFQRLGIDIVPTHEIDYLTMAISLVASTRGVALLPGYALKFLPASMTSRPLKGEPPTIDLVLGHHRANASPLLKLFLGSVDAMIAQAGI